MSKISYSVEEMKRQAQRNRRARVKQLRREGDFDEDGEAFQKTFDWDITKRLLRYLRPYRKQVFGAMALLLVYSAVVPVFPYLISLIIDRYIRPVAEPFTNLSVDERYEGILTIVLIYMGLRILNFGLRYGYTQIENVPGGFALVAGFAALGAVVLAWALRGLRRRPDLYEDERTEPRASPDGHPGEEPR